MPTTDNNQKELLTIDEMAEILGVHKNWLYQRTKLGTSAIPHVRLGKFVRFQKDKVLDFLEKQTGL